MCLGGGGSKPVAPATPAPAPAPVPSDSAPILTAQQRRNRIAQLSRYGMLSTIKTGGQGIAGTGINLTGDESGKKKTLGG